METTRDSAFPLSATVPLPLIMFVLFLLSVSLFSVYCDVFVLCTHNGNYSFVSCNRNSSSVDPTPTPHEISSHFLFNPTIPLLIFFCIRRLFYLTVMNHKLLSCIFAENCWCDTHIKQVRLPLSPWGIPWSRFLVWAVWPLWSVNMSAKMQSSSIPIACVAPTVQCGRVLRIRGCHIVQIEKRSYGNVVTFGRINKIDLTLIKQNNGGERGSTCPAPIIECPTETLIKVTMLTILPCCSEPSV